MKSSDNSVYRSVPPLYCWDASSMVHNHGMRYHDDNLLLQLVIAVPPAPPPTAPPSWFVSCFVLFPASAISFFLLFCGQKISNLATMMRLCMYDTTTVCCTARTVPWFRDGIGLTGARIKQNKNKITVTTECGDHHRNPRNCKWFF